MIKKLFGVLICVFLFLASVSIIVIACDEENPELIDKSNDTLWKHFDIISGWFHEDSNEPDYLYISMKVNNLKNHWFGGSYLIEWTSYSGRYACASMIGPFNDYDWRCGNYSDGEYSKYTDLNPCAGSIFVDENIMTWKISKNKIGNLEPGDVITKTRAVSCITGILNLLLPLRGLPMFHDIGPDVDYGLDYVIKY